MSTTEPNYEIITLSNGLRCVFRRGRGVAYCGVAVNAGSRDEDRDNHGLAHFVEHTLFKGTSRRRSWQIASRMERVGGELNAYTTKEETMVYTVAPHGYLPRAIDLLADVVCDSVFPDTELEKEREVVIDEINSYLDSPADAVYDEFEDLLYAGSTLGHNILGDAESVRRLTGEDCRRFVRRYYTPANMVMYCVADTTAGIMEKLLERNFGHMHFDGHTPVRDVPASVSRFGIVRDNGRHQAHTLMGCTLFGRHDPRRHALLLLNNYIGGPCMNSRLNLELRERRGYVYAADSSVALMSNCGTFQVYYGCDREHVGACARIVNNIIAGLAENPMKPRVFEQVKRQYLGQLEVSASHAESRAMALGKSLLYYGRVVGVDEAADAIKALRPEDVCDVAGLIASMGLSSLTLA